MTTEAVTQALNERDAALQGRIETVTKSLGNFGTRLAAIEQNQHSSPDLGPVGPGHRKSDSGLVLRVLATPRASLDGEALAVSQELKARLPEGAQGEYFIPIQTKNFDAGAHSPSAGAGSWIPTTVHQDVIAPLYEQSLFLALNPTRIEASGGPVALPRVQNDLTAYSVGGDGEDLTSSDPQVDTLVLTPSYYGALTTVHMKVIHQASPGVERLIFDSISRQVGVKIDADAFAGLYSSAGNIVTSDSPQTVEYEQLVEMERLLIDDKVQRDGSWVYVASPAAFQAMKLTTKTASDTASSFIAEPDGKGGWLANGFPLFATTHLSGLKVLLFRPKSVVYGDWGSLGLSADPYGANFAAGSVSFRGFFPFDFDVQHAEAICRLN